MHNYHDSMLALPSGVYLPAQWFWRASLLPYMEQGNLYQKVNFKTPSYCFLDPIVLSTDNPNTADLKAWSCPSDPNIRKIYKSFAVGGADYMPQSYFGICDGVSYFGNNGTFFLSSDIKLKNLTDGLSNTAVIGERGIPDGYYWGWGLCGAGERDSYLSFQDGLKGGSKKVDADTWRFWSYHPGGVQFAFADGSVRFVTYSTNFNILTAMATRDGGEVLQLP
jgi:prepilin-type processing-associated H-X9-DG protein